MITVNAQNKIEINFEKLKGNPKVTSLIETIKKYNIDISDLNKDQQDEIISCLFIAIR